MLEIVTKGYPDRLGSLYLLPVNFVLRGLHRCIKPFMPRNLSDKVHLLNLSNGNTCLVSTEGLGNHVPTNLGGDAVHASGYLACRHSLPCVARHLTHRARNPHLRRWATTARRSQRKKKP